MATCRIQIQIDGIVQGVGFRPFVFRLAQECGLTGTVSNTGRGVDIEVEGPEDALARFRRRLTREKPVAADITRRRTRPVAVGGDSKFRIVASTRNGVPTVLISPDLATCQDCERELFDPDDRRHGYPFINCTNCGPRYTIVSAIPYDRQNTTMSVFPMCPQCSAEYGSPADRRFHAQPDACAVCGPRVVLADGSGHILAEPDPIDHAVRLLRQGRVLAIRGVGGFHLAVDATNDASVQLLRRRKARAEKPFALMADDIATVQRFCHVSAAEANTLQQPTRPIVLLRRRNKAGGLAPSVAPGSRLLGFMLPYTPLHFLLLRHNFAALVMTSGNLSEEPIAIGNEEALTRLAGLADFFLLHNREIRQRCDDSIVRMTGRRVRMLRRARGYVPRPLTIAGGGTESILACGGELKNTIALSRGHQVFLSQHIGDLENPAALDFFTASIRHLGAILEIEPDHIAHDLHPDYFSTRWALQQTALPHTGVQHHHAHLAAVLAENHFERPAIGLILDGTGYGLDGTIWGGEVLIGDGCDFSRFAWLEPVPMPGGEAAVREPWRMAVSYLHRAFVEAGEAMPAVAMLARRPAAEISLLRQMIQCGLNAPLTSSCGRLFDAVAALLDVRERVTYEAQAAIELEMLAHRRTGIAYAGIDEQPRRGPLGTQKLIRRIVDDVAKGVASASISARFHESVAALFAGAAVQAREETGIETVGLSGGVMQNARLFLSLQQRLRAKGFRVLSHSQVPCNDGGLAFGQTAVAAARLQRPTRAAGTQAATPQNEENQEPCAWPYRVK